MKRRTPKGEKAQQKKRGWTKERRILRESTRGCIQPSIQRSPLFRTTIIKKDPGRAKQNSLATARTNFTKPGTQNKGDLCTEIG